LRLAFGLAARGLEPGRFAVRAAAGFANVAIETWPAENFGAALREVRARHGLRTVVIGHTAERAHLEPVARAVEGAELWLGARGELPRLAALIAEAGLFLGNDTGALHLAAAVGCRWWEFTGAARGRVLRRRRRGRSRWSSPCPASGAAGIVRWQMLHA
jgi:hypothetical protein